MSHRNANHIIDKPPASSAALRTRTRADMRASVLDGVFSQPFSSVAGPGSVLITSLALSLGATSSTLGLIFTAGPIFQGAQILGPLLLPAMAGSRKKGVLAAVAAGRGIIFLVPVAVAFFSPPAALATLVVCFLLSQVLNGAAASMWTSWIGSLIPRRIRGRFLGRRLQPAIVAGLVAAFAASLLKDLAAPGGIAGLAGFLRQKLGLAQGIWGVGGEHYAFIIIFAAAAALGVAALLPLKAMSDRPTHERRFTFAAFAEPFRDRAFRPLLFLFGAWFFAIYFGSPFWQPFFLNELGLSLTTIQIYNLVSTISMAATAALWGKLVDRFGNRPVFRALMLLSIANAFVYVFMTRDNYWWLWPEAATSGAMWGGAGVVTTNFLLRLSPEHKRDAYVAVFAVVTGACGLISSLASGQIIGLLPATVTLGSFSIISMKVAFAITAFLRLLVQFPMYRVREPRAAGFRHMMRAVTTDARLWLQRWLPRSMK